MVTTMTGSISNRAEALYQHVRALEGLQEAKDEAAADYNERKALVKEDGFDTNIVAAILKRRKSGKGQTATFDQLLSEYEDMIADREDADKHGMERLIPDGVESVTISGGGYTTTISRNDEPGAVDHDHDPDGDRDRSAGSNVDDPNDGYHG